MAQTVPEVMTETEERFDRARQTVGLFLGPIAGFLIWLWPIPGLSAPAHDLAWILAIVVVYWITEPIPIPVTALMGPVLCILAGVGTARDVLAPFSNPIIFLFIGSFLIAQAMIVHGLDRRFALGILQRRWIGASPGRLLFAFGAITGFVSMWVSNTATAAMMLPIAVGILNAIRQAAQAPGRGDDPAGLNRYSTGLMLMVAYAASVGGIGTIIGSPPNLIGVGLIRQQIGIEISFLEWMAFAVPLLLVMYVGLYVLLLGMHRPSGFTLDGVEAYIRSELRRLGPWTAGQRNAAVAFLVAVTLWIAPGGIALIYGTQSPAYEWYNAHLPESVVVLLAAILLFLLPVDWKRRACTLSWKDAAQIDWGTILLFGGGLSLGDLMFKTGLAETMGRGLMGLLSVQSVWGVTALAIFLGIVISELTSNTASANMVIPVVIAIAEAAGVNPLPPALGACLGASYGFMLPISTPPNAIVYGSGLIPITKMIRAGIVFDLIGFLIIWMGLRILLPFLGYL